MDIAIVTGAETPLGIRLIERLIVQGCRVHGIGNNFSNVTFASPYFEAHAIDLSDMDLVQKTASAIIEKEKAINILVHAIDVTPGAPFEKLPVGNLEAILKIGLLGPVMLTRMLLPNLLQFRGQLINIIPANKSGHPASAVNALIEGGLRDMNSALFDQARDAGLRVTNLILRQNSELSEATDSSVIKQNKIDPEHVALTVEYLLNPEATNVPNELILHPRLSEKAESPLPETPLPLDPYSAVHLPPKEYFPPEQKPVPTKEKDKIERTIPYTDEEMEERIYSALEDYELHPERYDSELRKQKSRSKKNKTSADKNSPVAETNQQEEGSSSKRRRGKRRGGKNRNKDNNTHETSQKSLSTEPENKQSGLSTEVEKAANSDSNPTKGSAESSDKNKQAGKEDKRPKRSRNRRRGGSRLKPIESVVEKFAPDAQPYSSAPLPKSSPGPVEPNKNPSAVKPTAAANTEQKPVPKKKASEPKEKVEKPPAKKKTATKKVTKKAAKKATKKKAVKKKAAKKAAKKKAAKPKTKTPEA